MFSKFSGSGSGTRSVFIASVIAAAVIGFLAGMGGQLVGRTLLLDTVLEQSDLVALNNTFLSLLEKYRLVATSPSDQPLELVIRRTGETAVGARQVIAGSLIESLEGGTVTFYRSRKAGTDVVATGYRPADAVGRGFVLTSDGWLVTTAAVASEGQSLVAVRAAGDVATVEKVVTDPLTSLVFVKVSARSWPVVSFAREDRVVVGGAAVALVDGGLVSGTLENTDLAWGETARSGVRSTDRLDTLLGVSASLGRAAEGELIVDEQGSAIGVVTHRGETTAVVPVALIRNQLDSITRTGVVARVSAGMSYVLLGRDVTLDPSAGDVSMLVGGALVYRSTTVGAAGVVRSGPAATAGIVAGDVILKIDGEVIDAKHDLARVIQSYQPGTTVNVTLWRAGAEQTLPLTLTAL